MCSKKINVGRINLMKKMKTKTSMTSIRKYLRELSVVVVGIALTLGVGAWISHRNSQKDLEQYLNTIKLELKRNIEQIEDEINALDEPVNYSRYLLSHNEASLDADTIQKYYVAINTIRFYKAKYNAFEMFKSSGNMRLISNKELMLSIWEAYDEVDLFQVEFQGYYNDKREKYYQEYDLKQKGKVKHILLYDFFFSRRVINLQIRCKTNLKALKETVEKLEKEIH